MVKRYPPDLYFGALERWYPTDHRQYVVETEGGPAVDGFTALEAYSRVFKETGNPPGPVVFYRVVEAAPGIDAIQYGFYSVFDQFTVNFHWHDWELFQVFVDQNDRPGAYRVTPETLNETFEDIREDLVVGKTTLLETLNGEIGGLRGLSRTLSEFDGDDEVSAQIARAYDSAAVAPLESADRAAIDRAETAIATEIV